MKTLRWLALVTLAVATPAAGQEEEIVLISDMAIDGYGNVVHNPVIVVRGNQIRSVRSSRERPTGNRVIDLTGYTILPGLIDGHVHITVMNVHIKIVTTRMP